MIERAVLDAALSLREPYLLATVMRVRGSAYRLPGARMLVARDRWVAGSVSGGCLEGDILQKGWWRTEHGPCVVTYDTSDEGGLGLGCQGVIDVLLERGPASPVDPIAFLARCRERQARGVLATSSRGEHASQLDGELDGDPRLLEGPSDDVLVEEVVPPPRLFVFGGGHDAVPVVQLARTLGWETIVCEPHARTQTRARFTDADEVVFGSPDSLAPRVDASFRALALVIGHRVEQDRAYLEMLLASRAAYIGVLGPRRRTTSLLAELGHRPGDDPRVHAPVGLALGAESPAEIALEIVAEIQSVLARSPASALRERVGAIHARAPVPIAGVGR